MQEPCDEDICHIRIHILLLRDTDSGQVYNIASQQAVLDH